jgi:SAM-dependent methyltransferase
MIANPQEMRALTHELTTSTWTFAALGALFESGLVDHLREPRSLDELAARCSTFSKGRIERCLDVAAAAGVVLAEGSRYRLAEGAMPFSAGPMRAALIGDIRANLMQAMAFLDSSSGGATSGWRHTNAALLQAQGDASAGFAPMLKAHFIGSMGDLAARLEAPGARFLDVGVGVAALAISMCRTFPGIRVVGLETFDVPLGIAQKNVASAGLTERIELRQSAVEELRDEESFELAWLPSFFIAAPAMAAAVERVRAALRPGGWLLFPAGGSAGEARSRAMYALLSELWGGPALSAAEAEGLLKGVGFSTVRVLFGSPWAPPMLLAQR